VGNPVGPNSGDQQKYSYRFQDDAPNPGQVRTDQGIVVNGSPTGAAVTPFGYSHKLGDIFHSEPVMLDVPQYFQYLGQGLPGYSAFVTKNAKRRRVVFVGANDGFLHAFDGGVWNRDSTNFPGAFDLGTGREIFAYTPKGALTNATDLIGFPPRPQYFVDGNFGTTDVYMDPAHSGTPVNAKREWRTVLAGSLRQGGPWIYALDVTQPDQINATGDKTAALDTAPDCLSGAGCQTAGGVNRPYPSVLWEFTDDGSAGLPAMGQTWSKPVLGRIKVYNGASFEDRYVAIFGGGLDNFYNTGDPRRPRAARSTSSTSRPERPSTRPTPAPTALPATPSSLRCRRLPPWSTSTTTATSTWSTSAT
jgi:Tfp pilus tip-associated adhesin PilY1